MQKIALCAVVMLAVTLTGCSEYHADIPEFSTSSDRDTGFMPKQEEHLPVSANNEDLNNRVRQGFSDVEEKASSYSDEIADKSSDVEKGSLEIKASAKEMQSDMEAQESVQDKIANLKETEPETVKLTE